MKLKKIKISGFRSIGNEIEFELTQICALIGANNVGKSNILLAIYKVLGRDWVTVNSFDEDDVYNKQNDIDINIEIEFDEPFKYEQFKDIFVPIPKIKFLYTRYRIGESKGQRRLEKSCLNLNNSDVIAFAKRPRKGEQHQRQPLTTIPQEVQENIPIIYIGSDRNLKNQLPSARNSLLGTLLKDINIDFERDDNIIRIKNKENDLLEINRKDRFNSCIKAAIESLRTDEFIELEKSIKENALKQLGFDLKEDFDKLDIFFNPLTSFDFYKSLEIWVEENNFRINATELGGGFQNAIVIAILKAFEERKKQGAIFLIEEPEMFLHPQMQRSLNKTIREIGKTNQVIYVTHSPHFLSIPNFDEIMIVKKSTEGTSIHKSTLKANPKVKEKYIKDLDPVRNELFFAKKLLIVEGDTEKLALSEYAKRMGYDIDSLGSTIIQVGGKRNLKNYIDLAKSFDIETGFCYDTDSSDFKKNMDEEKIFNKELEEYRDKNVDVWCFDKDYECELRKYWGESNYQTYCQNYFGYTKAIRARLFASDNDISIPEFIIPIINWLANINEDDIPF